jgi:two-component system cell cycle sensor histidine kinase/response regulator CckA
MRESPGTKAELIAAIKDLKQKIKKLEKSESKGRQAESQREAALEAMKTSEQKYRSLTENINLGIYRNTIGPAGKFIEANPAIIKMFGYESKKEFLAMKVSDLYQDPKDRNKFNAKMLKAGVVRGEELGLKKKDGSFFVGSVSAVAVKDELGQVTYYDGIIDNISERKQAEKEKEQLISLQRATIESTADGILVIDHTGKITDFNQRFAQIWRIPEAVLAARDDTEALSFVLEQLLDPQGFLAKVQELYTAPAHESFDILQFKDGRCFERYSRPQMISGRPVGRVWSFRDVSERKQAEDALKKSEIKFRSLFEAASDGIFYLSMNGELVEVNNSFAGMHGYSVAEMQKMNLKDLDTPETSRLFPERMRRTMAGEIFTFDVEHYHQDGHTFPLEVTTSVITLGNEKYVLAFHRDISKRKQAEKELHVLEERLQWAEKMEAIGTLAGGIAHDFNNLLMGIQGYASMTLTNLEPENPNYERLQRIEQLVQSGAELTSQLLGFARGGRYEVKPTDMNDIIEKTSSMFGRTKKEISIQRKHEKKLWSVEVDRGQMEQVFLNLYVNAWQAMSGGGKINLETENVLLKDERSLPFSVRPGRYVKITVTDTGTGMDEKTRERIFDPFFTTKGMGRGIGLGLASVYGIVKGHRGMINVYSEPGHGTTFSIYLPASDKEVVEEKPVTWEMARGMETILVVEDEKTVLEVNRDLLQSLGYKVYAVGSGQEGIAVYQEKRNAIDLVILDMVMPGISGGEVFDRLRKINPGVKVLLSSGYSLNGEAQHIMDRGCNGFLQKPFQIEKLSRKVREMLGK